MNSKLHNLFISLFPFLSWLKGITKKTIISDMLAGLTGAIIVLPQSIAFATIAGLPVEYGLYTAIVTPIVAALFGSSRHLISGPTTAISLVIFSTLNGFAEVGSPEFVSLAITLTLLAGIYQFAFGLAKLGRIVDFVSHTVVIGFTAGAAILILTSQIKSFLGIEIHVNEFYEVWKEVFLNISNINNYSLLIGGITLLTAILIKKIHPKIPNLFIALIIGSLVAYFIGAGEHSVSFVAEIPSKLPSFVAPDISFEVIKKLVPSAFAVAILGLIEAISISRSIASKSHQKIDANQEFIGQGLSNIVGSFFSSYAGSGSFTRSGVNYSAGAKTPLSAIFAAIFLALIVLLIAPVTKYLPIPAMAGVIMLVGYNLINFSTIKHILTKSYSETIVLLVTFLSTLFLELEFAIYLGILLSLVIFLNKTSHPNIVRLYSNYDSKKQKRVLIGGCKIQSTQKASLLCPQLEIIRLDMSLYFGSINYVSEIINEIRTKKGKKHILLICTSINMIDMAGVEMLEEQCDILKEEGGGIYFVDLKTVVYSKIKRYGIVDYIGKENFFFTKKGAINHIYNNILNKDFCENVCKNRVFKECGNNTDKDWSIKPDIKNQFSLKDFGLEKINSLKHIFK